MRNSLKKTFVLSSLLLATTVTGIYATWQFSEAPPQKVTDNFNVVLNEMTFAPPETLYITAVELLSTQNATSLSVDFAHPTYLESTIQSKQTNCNVTYKVTVYNNTNVTYWYLGPSWEDETGANDLIGGANAITITTKDNSDDSGNTFNTADWVPPYTSRDFYVTYGFGYNAIQPSLYTLISLDFGIKMDAVHDKFLAILNDKTSNVGYYYLAEMFDKRYAEDGSTIIANVGQDLDFFNTLFGGPLTINVNGVETPITLSIRRDNVDNRTTGDSYNGGGPTGCEYTLYITVDPLNSPTGEAIVYVVSYSEGGVGAPSGTWYQLGQLYEGTAPSTEYRDSDKLVVDTTKWEATQKDYEFIGDKSYKVGYEQGDQYDKYKSVEELMSAADQDVFNDIDNTGVLKKVYEIVYSSANYNKPGYEGLRTAFEKAAPFYNVMNNGQEVKVKRNSTRAEILPYMIAIQTALDYYNEVNP